MPLLGHAALAMWWTISPDMRHEFGDWHSHEHFPERMSIPGFRRGSRWRGETDEGQFFVLYELASHETLSSPPYLQRLNDPTPWSRKMMPHHRGMVRSQCRVVASHGGGIAGSLATLRLSPRAGASDELRAAIEERLAESAGNPGLTGAHFLYTDAPSAAGLTTEQRIRGGDGSADWIVLVAGHDPSAVQDVIAGELSHEALARHGVAEGSSADHFRLSYSMSHEDAATLRG